MPLFWPAGLASAQEVYGPSDLTTEADSDEPIPLVEAEPCEEDIREDGAIVVCRELPDSERYMSPLPKPVESDRPIIPGLTDPPCWVENRGGACFRFGYVPPYPPVVDLSVLPEPLTEEEAAAVSRVAEKDEPDSQPVTGRRVPIDLTED
ncbi:hypothetical protein OZN62_10220 [Aurantiacibacter sp. MUD11]|uniref:hypothetical protein n=1 Tax=Aurantiacibacter sp. MUD11 TaxID=3003265 RepID=UPI0022AA2B65|nr:hypothetical protein [Aurantiacibacter sp. MUD11]WAT17300.1 hypothetical protein OZN62_10220 [Aurantiacibacter sp. MUD11]